MRTRRVLVAACLAAAAAQAQEQPRATLLLPARVFDGEAMHDGWTVLVRDNRVEAVGPRPPMMTSTVDTLRLTGLTLIPGLIEAHSHLLLHPYNEAPWDQQVLNEPEALRVSRIGEVDGEEAVLATRRVAISAQRARATPTSD